MNSLKQILDTGRQVSTSAKKLDTDTMLKYVSSLSTADIDYDNQFRSIVAELAVHFAQMTTHLRYEDLRGSMYYWRTGNMFLDDREHLLEAIRSLLNTAYVDHIRLRNCCDHLFTICHNKNIDIIDAIHTFIG